MSPLRSLANPVAFHQSIRVLMLLFPVALHQSIRVLKLSFRVVLHQSTKVIKLWFPLMLSLKSPANPVTFHQNIRVFKLLFPVTFHQSSRILKLSSRFLSRAILLPFTKALEFQSYDILSPFINASILSLILWSPKPLFHLISPAAELCSSLKSSNFSHFSIVYEF